MRWFSIFLSCSPTVAFLQQPSNSDQHFNIKTIPGPDFKNRFLRLADALGVTGPRVFDLQIALIALENGAREIWTHDQNFLSTKGLRVYDPL